MREKGLPSLEAIFIPTSFPFISVPSSTPSLAELKIVVPLQSDTIVSDTAPQSKANLTLSTPPLPGAASPKAVSHISALVTGLSKV